MTEQGPQRSVAVLGATGSVGQQTLDVIDRHRDRFRVSALTANNSVDALIAAARRHAPEFVAIGNAVHHAALKTALEGSGIEVAAGPDAVVEAARRPTDFVMGGIVGFAALAPMMAAVERGAAVGLASKESLVCAGELMTGAAARHGATLLPVDSEHNAIFQVLDRNQPKTIDKIILTASGGPFRERPRETLADVTPEQAVAHPNWDMGAKISVDSATMMNKGLEVIEAARLFPVTHAQIEVVVHPQSIVHSMVAYRDGSVLAQLGLPDMRVPIAYALGWPERLALPGDRLDLAAIGQLTFETPDRTRFPALDLADQALSAGGSAPIALNAANEVAVAAFLERRLGYLVMTDVIAQTLDEMSFSPIACLDDVFDADRGARQVAERVVERRAL